MKTHNDLDLLPSYLQDTWWTPPRRPGNVSANTTTDDAGTSTARGADPSVLRELCDASTGLVTARVGAVEPDLPAAVDHARTVGQVELGRLTIHERALKLRELAVFLNGRREELYEISAQTGATQMDSMVDIDGGIGVLFTLSSKGRRELPNANVIVEGPVEVLSKDGTFLGEHILTRIPGVAVQINAFNFPVWGMLEKFAPAFMAGVPTLVKPATPTLALAVAAVALMIESGILPAGSLQLVSGGARNLPGLLDYRDMVSFTGSASTAKLLRGQLPDGVRFTAETDSLNAAILGPDAVPGTPEFDAFIRSVVTEMSVKAGQKCTAVRRVIVPEQLKSAVISAIAARLDRGVVLGDPRTERVTMGPLASLEQLRCVQDAVAEMVAAGARTAYQGGSIPLPGLERGAFMRPVVLDWADPTIPAAHMIEAFGPVCGVLGYASQPTDDGGASDVVRLAALGAGSLVATVCTNDPDFAQRIVTGIAAHHGRVLILNGEDARSSTGHGAPVPHLIHGGPGRAGGGEELGGVRSVKHHMQRTALQGSPNMLTAVTGVWHAGADRVTAGDPDFGGVAGAVHPFRKSLAELRIGDAYASGLRRVTLADITAFAQSTKDTFYVHTDRAAAERNPFFSGIVAHGYLLVSWAAGLFVDPEPGPVLANYGLENLRFLTPVAAGDSLRVVLTAKSMTPRVTDDYGEVRWDTVLYNQKDDVVATYDVLTLVEKAASL